MRLIDLTMPIWEGMGMGGCFANESPFTIDHAFPDHPEIGLARYGMCSEPGTRLVLAGPEGMDFEKQDLSELILKDACIVDIPLGIDEGMTPEKLDAAIPKADFRMGDVLIIRTGWGTLERLEEMGDDYQWRSPNYPDLAAKRLAELMKAKNSPIIGYDNASINTYTPDRPIWEAAGRPKNWDREAGDWSKEAKEALPKIWEGRAKQRAAGVGGAGTLLNAGIILMGGLINVTHVRQERIKIIALPLKLRGLRAAPARVIAVEE